MITYLNTDEIIGNPEQPRKHFPQQYIQELANSIKADGQMQAGEVIPVELITDKKDAYTLPSHIKYIVIGGECRLRACIEAGLEYKANIVNTPLTRQQILIKAIVENEQRKDPTPIENAKAYQALKNSGLTIADIAKKTCKRKDYIQRRIDLLKLNEAYQLAVAQGGITIGQAGQLVRLSPTGQIKLVEMIEKGKVRTYQDVCNAADAILNQETQSGFFAPPKPPTATEKRQGKLIDQILTKTIQIIQKSFSKNGEITIQKSLARHQAKKIVSQIQLVVKHLQRIEEAINKQIIINEVNNETN